jgi:hypothetical protein
MLRFTYATKVTELCERKNFEVATWLCQILENYKESWENAMTVSRCFLLRRVLYTILYAVVECIFVFVPRDDIADAGGQILKATDSAIQSVWASYEQVRKLGSSACLRIRSELKVLETTHTCTRTHLCSLHRCAALYYERRLLRSSPRTSSIPSSSRLRTYVPFFTNSFIFFFFGLFVSLIALTLLLSDLRAVDNAGNEA